MDIYRRREDEFITPRIARLGRTRPMPPLCETTAKMATSREFWHGPN